MAILINSINTPVNRHIPYEVPSGTIDGVNDTFNLTAKPLADTINVHLNGIQLKQGASYDFIIASSTITFSIPPVVGDKLLSKYWVST